MDKSFTFKERFKKDLLIGLSESLFVSWWRGYATVLRVKQEKNKR
jgi:hypothetical protein